MKPYVGMRLSGQPLNINPTEEVAGTSSARSTELSQGMGDFVLR